jgi:serine/threonine protein phosphatase 1
MTGSSFRTFVIGDVHGQLALLERLLALLPFDAQADELVFIGDLIDRGPDVRGVLERVLELQATANRVTVLCGNHEQMLRLSLLDETMFQAWLRMGGRATCDSFCPPTRLRRWTTFVRSIPPAVNALLEHLPYAYENAHARYVHAGARRGADGAWVIDPSAASVWYRERAFFTDYDGPLLVVGHTPTPKLRRLIGEEAAPERRQLAWQRPPLIAIDCGAGDDGPLCAVELPARHFFYAFPDGATLIDAPTV